MSKLFKMQKAGWIGNRILAAMVGCICTGLVAALLFDLWIGLGMLLGWWPGSNLVNALIFDAVWFSAIALVLGIVPATLVILLTAARLNPWAALRTLVIGSVIGFIPVAPLLEKSSNNCLILFALILGPTVGGIVASRFLSRTPAHAN